jgi:hypothetical protein
VCDDRESIGFEMNKVRGEGFSVRFTRRPSYGKKSETSAMIQPIQKVQGPSIQKHFMLVADRAERGFTFALKPKAPMAADPIFKELSQMAKKAAAVSAQKKKRTPEQLLIVAALAGDCPAIRKLVMQGVDLETRDAHGRTPMNIATQYGLNEVVATLRAAKEMRYLASLGELPQTAFFKRFQRGTGTGG